MSGFRGAVIFVCLTCSILFRGDVAASTACAGIEPTLGSIATALDEGRWDDAEQLLQPLEMSHPKCSRVTVGVARLRAAHGNPAEAERLFSQALMLAPDDAVLHALFARFQLSRGLLSQAQHLTAQSLAIDPECADALVVQGQIMGQRGLLGEARAALERAVALEPRSAEAHYALGVFFFRINLFNDAARHFESAVALGPKRPQLLDYLGFSFEMLGEVERAERAYRDALQANSGPFFDPSVYLNFGRFLLKQGRFEESLPLINRAVELHPQRRGPRYQRAKWHLAQGDSGSAREDAERALALGAPGDLVLDVQVYYLLSKIYTRLGEMELAREYSELARTTEIPDHANDRRR